MASSSSSSGARQTAGVEKKPKKKPAAISRTSQEKWNAFKKAARKGKSLDATLANFFKPLRTVLFEDEVEQRARAFYTLPGTRVRVQENCLLSTGATNALLTVLQFAWGQYCKDNLGEECPYDFDAIRHLHCLGTCHI